MSYQDNVVAAGEALKRGEDANWELARLTFESTREPGRGDIDQTDKATMVDWSADVRAVSGRKFSDRTGRFYKAMWAYRLSALCADNPPWTETSYLVKPAYTPEAVLERTGERYFREAPSEVKREHFAQLAADPEIVDAAMQDHGTRAALAGAWTRHEQRESQRVERIADADPVARDLTSRQAILDLRAECDRFARRVADILPRCAPLADDGPGGDRAWLEILLARDKQAIELIETYVQTGRTDLDSFLKEVLSGAN